MVKRLDEATEKRLRAGRMLLAGKRPAEVAGESRRGSADGVHMEGLLDEGGIDALRDMESNLAQPSFGGFLGLWVSRTETREACAGAQ